MNNIKIAVVGLGTVGSNVVKSIESLNKSNKINQNIKFEIIGISAKNKSKKRIIDISKYKWFDDPIDLFNFKFDVLIELIGTEKGISYNLIKKALSQNINVITANKALLAKYGNELFNIAKNNKVKLLFEAAVAGGIPIINLLKNSIFLNKINHISGILNGTTNFILSQMEKNNCSFELMHCVSTYPMKIEDANLITINQLKEEYNCKVGYSGHENGVVVSLAATMLGITSLERHITLDRTMYGSDQAASLELTGMKNLSSSIEKVLISIGEPSLGKIIDEEIPIAKKLRAHIKN